MTEKISALVLTRPTGLGWLGCFGFSHVLVFVFLVAVAYLLVMGVGIWGIQIPNAWSFAITDFVWWIGIGHAGTLISAFLLLMHQKWRTSINRIAEAMTIFAVMCAGMFPLLHLGRPWFFYWLLPYPNTMEPVAAVPQRLIWDVFAVSTYFTVSLLFWYMGMIPDLATLRDRATGRLAQIVYGMLALGWRNSARHWHRFEMAYLLLGRAGHPAGHLGPLGGEFRFRHFGGAGVARDGFSAVFRRRGHLLRLRHGPAAVRADPPLLPPEGVHHHRPSRRDGQAGAGHQPAHLLRLPERADRCRGTPTIPSNGTPIGSGCRASANTPGSPGPSSSATPSRRRSSGSGRCAARNRCW